MSSKNDFEFLIMLRFISGFFGFSFKMIPYSNLITENCISKFYFSISAWAFGVMVSPTVM